MPYTGPYLFILHHKQSLLTKTSGITAIIMECKQRSNENLAAASEPKNEKYRGSDKTPVVTKIKLLAARKERQPNTILDFALISEFSSWSKPTYSVPALN